MQRRQELFRGMPDRVGESKLELPRDGEGRGNGIAEIFQ